MSVYKRNRSKSKIDFYDKANRVNDAIQTLVDNPKYYPKNQTFKRAIPLKELSDRVVMEICVANENRPQTYEEYLERRKSQTLAIGLAEALLQKFQTDCLHLKTIPSGQKKFITGLIVDLRDNLKAWKKSDKNRYLSLPSERNEL